MTDHNVHEHDPLCLYQDDGYGSSCEVCRVIAEVRADERERIAQAIDSMDRERYSVEGYWTKRVSDALDVAARIARGGGDE